MVHGFVPAGAGPAATSTPRKASGSFMAPPVDWTPSLHRPARGGRYPRDACACSTSPIGSPTAGAPTDTCSACWKPWPSSTTSSWRRDGTRGRPGAVPRGDPARAGRCVRSGAVALDELAARFRPDVVHLHNLMNPAVLEWAAARRDSSSPSRTTATSARRAGSGRSTAASAARRWSARRAPPASRTCRISRRCTGSPSDGCGRAAAARSSCCRPT